MHASLQGKQLILNIIHVVIYEQENDVRQENLIRFVYFLFIDLLKTIYLHIHSIYVNF